MMGPLCGIKNKLYGHCRKQAIGLTEIEFCPEYRPNRLCGVYIFIVD
ncbi:hypothetical protein NEIMUCOT_04932 [Neisseria mucosa ATCC 25996]|uniref:Uncharacterized protein n=1 Tax=Neisseria mucosa (strain ATCC 25996 / DSM 4631 / NCTC 10774 / M26) TaxID=546266 RepID=D2ZWE0_NEIM2|nr:hypothetical protein NEIMUCOT_04932 [Neisseria mucosa ATCC 25996]